MNKTAIKNYAIWARRELIKAVSIKASQYGIEDGKPLDSNLDTVNGKLLSPAEKKQRQALITKIKLLSDAKNAYQQVMEEVAYTWFNRFTALRFMEVNDVLPSHIRVFTDENNNFKPQILAEAINVELEGLNKQKVFSYKNASDDEGLYKYLLITQCNALSSVLPGMFQKLEDYTELLFPDFILRNDSVVAKMISDIPEEDFKDAVQIIGWMYQYYNTEPKDQVFADLKKNIKITKDKIPAATQLFTPDWIVRYMVENSLGRLWTEGHPTQTPKANWKYYLEEAEQTEDVNAELAKIRAEYAKITPENIKCIDPCMGSGHILCYMFDVLIQIYQQYGYSDRDAVASIIQNNIYGLDIDERAAQLAYFAVTMKACQYDKRFLTRGLSPNVYEVKDSLNVDSSVVSYFANNDNDLKRDINIIIDELKNAKEYGSLTEVKPVNYENLYARIEEIKKENDLQKESTITELLPLINEAKVLGQKYDVVVTNPPYMGSGGMNETLSDYVKDKYPDSKSDMFAVFIEKCGKYAKKTGLIAMITQHAWMFLGSYEKLRSKLENRTLVNMAHLGARAFDEIGGEVVQTTAFVQWNCINSNYKGTYVRLVDFSGEKAKENEFLSGNNKFVSFQEDFKKIPGIPVAYWISSNFRNSFDNKKLGDYGETKQGFATGDNEKFLRIWHEADFTKIFLNPKSIEDCSTSSATWFPCNKGGTYNKWYGNNNIIAKWENNGQEMKSFKGSVIRNPTYYFKEGLTWSSLADQLSMRYSPIGFLFESKGSMYFLNEKIYLTYALGLLNSNVTTLMLSVLSPTLDFHEGPMSKVPMILKETNLSMVDSLVQQNISLSKTDWDSFETSWDFTKHPLIQKTTTIKIAYQNWQSECENRFNQLKKNEEELNRIFIEIYFLQDELTSEVEDKDVTVRKADLTRDIKSFISYAVGCMFGRYSLDKEGLVFAGGTFNNANYTKLSADKDAIIPICDDDNFTDDIVSRFVEFVSTVYGKETLEENLRFIADALGGTGTSREVIRNYFINGFYKDHLKIYQKRPIYWLFDSGKANGFKCLIYMHRYQKDTIARIRTDYVHERQGQYSLKIEELTRRANSASGSEKIKLNRMIEELKEKADELHKYEEKIHHLADQMIQIDLDDGVKHNYEFFKDVLAPLK